MSKTIGVIDTGSKIVNLACMKASSFHKALGDTVVLNPHQRGIAVDKAYISSIFTENKSKAAALIESYKAKGTEVVAGGTGWDLNSVLPEQIDKLRPDYSLYTVGDIAPRIKGIKKKETILKKAETIVNAGIGYTHRGCVRKCPFCIVPKAKCEGALHKVGSISELINPKSNVVILLDNNLTASPECLEILREIKERKLVIEISQGIDIRTMSPEVAKILSEIRHLRSLHYAFDLPEHESMVMRGIDTLLEFVRAGLHKCFVLVGYNTSFEMDLYRVRKLGEKKIDAYIMRYNKNPDLRLKHFARWVNAYIYKKCPDFEQYTPWVECRSEYFRTCQ
ncbi:MAG: radical SAM protein [Dissulfurispiraceae bacterium]